MTDISTSDNVRTDQQTAKAAKVESPNVDYDDGDDIIASPIRAVSGDPRSHFMLRHRHNS
jgi:hypothetical protein